MDSRERENAEQYARERLREKAQNEATCIALSGLFNQAQIEIASLTAEVERLRAELAAREWRTIESAPRDGTRIILASHNPPRVTEGYWMQDDDCKVLIGYCGGECRCPDFDYLDPYWFSYDGGFTEEHPPTHWMPLPPEPKL